MEDAPSASERAMIEAAFAAEEGEYRLYLEDLALTADDLRGKTIADVGAGARFFAVHVLHLGLTERVFSIVREGRSAFPGQLALIALTLEPPKRVLLDAMTFKGTGEALPLPDESVDLLLNHSAMPGAKRVGLDVADVVEEIEAAFDETVRVLKPGGEARFYPLVRAAFGEQLEWRMTVEEKLERLRGAGLEVQVTEGTPWRESDGRETYADLVIIRKP